MQDDWQPLPMQLSPFEEAEEKAEPEKVDPTERMDSNPTKE